MGQVNRSTPQARLRLLARAGDCLCSRPALHNTQVLATARAGMRDGLTPLRAARTCRLGTSADLPDAERIVLDLHRAYAGTTGRRST